MKNPVRERMERGSRRHAVLDIKVSPDLTGFNFKHALLFISHNVTVKTLAVFSPSNFWSGISGLVRERVGSALTCLRFPAI